MPLTDAEIRLLGWGALWVATDLALGENMDRLYKVPETFRGAPPTTPDELAPFITSDLRNFLGERESVTIADSALNEAQAKLVQNHYKAAAVILAAPTASAMLALNEALTDVSEALKSVERFRAAASFAGALATIITNGTASAPAPAGSAAALRMMTFGAKALGDAKAAAPASVVPTDTSMAQAVEAMARAVEAMARAVEAMNAAGSVHVKPADHVSDQKRRPSKPSTGKGKRS